MKWIGWAFLGLAAAGLAGAQSAGEVRGTVVDVRGGEPLAHVAVQLVGGDYRTVTDAAGRFRISPVAAGEYTLNVSTVGYRLIKRPFALAAGAAQEFEVILSPDTFRQTDTVEVSAGPFETTRQETPSTLTLLGAEAKNLGSVLADDPLRAVQALPGVTSNDDYDARFSIRGAGYERVGVYLDGVKLRSPFHTVQDTTGGGSMTAFNGDMIDSLELNTGAYSERFADASAGALEVRTREGSRTQPSVRVSVGMTAVGFMAEGPLGKGRRGSWLVGGRKGFIQYLLSRMDNADTSLAFDLADAQGKLNYDLTPKHNFSLTALESYSNMDRTKSKSKLGVNGVMTAGYHFTVGTAAWRYTPLRNLLVTNRAAWMREKYGNQNPNEAPLARGHYGEWVWDTSATWMWAGKQALEVGFGVRRLRDGGFQNQLLSAAPYARLLDRWEGTAARSGGYAQQGFSWAAGRVHLSAGARWDHHSYSGSSTFSPQAFLGLIPFAGTRVQLGFGQYAQFPELSSLSSPFGGRGLLPMRSNQAVAAVEQRFGERTRFRVEAWEREDRDLLFRPGYDPRVVGLAVVVPPLNPPEKNSLRGFSRGIEARLERRSANRLSGWISYTYGVTGMRDGVARTAFPSDWDQRHTVNVFATYRLSPSVNFSAKWAYGSGFPVPGYFRVVNGAYYLDTQRNRVRLPDFERLDVRMNKAWTRKKYKITLYGEVVNLTNHGNYRYENLGSYSSRTGAANVRLNKLFMVLPSVGMLFER